jgi:hypothetical protein
MKRPMILVLLPMLAAFALAPIPAKAATSQTVPVTVSWQALDGVLTLTATTLKKGTAVSDGWAASPALSLDPARTAGGPDDQTSYVSTVTIPLASLAPNTTYTFSYTIGMTAAQNSWLGTGSLTLTTGADPSVPPRSGTAGAEI